MFAIDCLKVNGTHLGTCIDRFYFGSCCRLEHSNDYLGNTIDAAIIPSREPPSRISTTTNKTPSAVTTHETSTKIETTPKTVTTTTTTTVATTTTKQPVTTTTKTEVTDEIRKQTNGTTTSATELSYKLSTFQMVEENTAKPETTTNTKENKLSTETNTSFKSTASSKLTTLPPKPRPNSKPPTTTNSFKITKPTFKPINSLGSTPAATATTTTSKTVVNTTTPPVVTKSPTTVVETTTTTKPTTSSTYTLTTTTEKPNVTTLLNNSSTTLSNEVPVISTVLESVSGNIATNEIEPAKQPTTTSTTEKAFPPFVTWTVFNEDTTIKPNNATEDQDWKPITTPDDWILLPNLSTESPPTALTTLHTVINFTAPFNTTEQEQPSTSSPAPKITTHTASLNDTESSTTGPVTTQPPPDNSSTITTLNEVGTTTETSSSLNMSDYTDVCGRRMYHEARIVGGEKATFGKWPWQISLRQWRTSTYLHKCGAALLNENWAITAAHCVDNVPPSDLLLRLGEHDLSTENEPYIHQERRIQIVASHPQFDPRTFEYDLALLRFYEPVQFQPNIIPVCVPRRDESFVGRTAHVTGWGRLYEDGPLPSVLQEVSVPVINNTVCESMYRAAGYIEHIPYIFICAGWRRGGFDSCEGDSGGPMVIQDSDKRFILSGVISWGIGCAEPNQPGVYTRISEFRDWINQILQF